MYMLLCMYLYIPAYPKLEGGGWTIYPQDWGKGRANPQKPYILLSRFQSFTLIYLLSPDTI